MKIFVKQLVSLVSQTRYEKQDCDGMSTCSKDDSCVEMIMKAEVYGRRSRGRQKKRWSDMVQQNMVTLRLKPEDAADRDKWRGRTHVADPSPRD